MDSWGVIKISKDIEHIVKIGMIKKIFRKICRSLAKFVFPNQLRIAFLKMAGIKIESFVTINEGFTLACDIGYEENLIIRERAALGPNVTVILTSHPNFSRLRDYNNTIHKVNIIGNVEIQNDAWIGAGSIILPNNIIGKYSIVGAGSVVTKSLPPYSIAVGVPARVIRVIEPINSRQS